MMLQKHRLVEEVEMEMNRDISNYSKLRVLARAKKKLLKWYGDMENSFDEVVKEEFDYEFHVLDEDLRSKGKRYAHSLGTICAIYQMIRVLEPHNLNQLSHHS